MRQVGHVVLTVALLGLVIWRPWPQVNQALGIVTQMDSLRMDSALHRDSLLLAPVAIALEPISDSLTYSVRARSKKNEYLKEESERLQGENQRLTVRNNNQKAKARRSRKTAETGDLNAMLQKQNPNGKSNAGNLVVSDLETELNRRETARSGRSAGAVPGRTKELRP